MIVNYETGAVLIKSFGNKMRVFITDAFLYF